MTALAGERMIDIVGGWARNKPCICGSGRKLKRCCGDQEVVVNIYCRHGDQVIGYLHDSGGGREVAVMSACQECVGVVGRIVEESVGEGHRW
jgi:hypothetical protein